MNNLNDFIIEDGVLIRYIGNGGKVVIPEEVTCVARRAFRQSFSVESVCFMGNVNKIEEEAFKGCVRMAIIDLPDSLESIGDNAFKECVSLTSIHLGRNVVEIGKHSFVDCGRLTGVWVAPENVIFYSDEFGVLFNKNQKRLISAPSTLSGQYTVPEGIETIGFDAFQNCGALESVVLPESIKMLDERAFYNCANLIDIHLPESLETVELACFSGCSSLKRVAFPKEMITIDNRIFANCVALEEVAMPEKIENIGEDIFINCGNLRKLHNCAKFFGKFDANVKDNIVLGWLAGMVVYNEDQEKAIKKHAVRNATRIFCKIKEDDGVSAAKLLECKDITLEQLEEWTEKCNNGSYPNMLAVLLDYKNKHFTEQTIEEYQDDKLEKELGIRERTVAEWKKIFKFVKDADGIRITGYKATDEVVVIPERIDGIPVKYIGDKAFMGLALVTSVLFSNNITEIGKAAFNGCVNLTKIELSNNLKVIGNNAFYDCSALEHIRIPSGVEAIGSGAFAHCVNLMDIEIPESVREIGTHAFMFCEKLVEISIPEGVVKLGTDLFVNCYNLEKVTFPETVTKISSQTFGECVGLKSIQIPKTVKLIDSWAFSNCKELAELKILGSKTKIGMQICKECPKVTIHAPAGSYAETYAKENNIPFVAE